MPEVCQADVTPTSTLMFLQEDRGSILIRMASVELIGTTGPLCLSDYAFSIASVNRSQVSFYFTLLFNVLFSAV